MTTKITDEKVDMIEEIIYFSEHIDRMCSGMDSEDLWYITLTMCRLASFIEAIPEEDRNAITNLPDYLSAVSNSMRDWSDIMSPVDGWPEKFLNRLEGRSAAFLH